MATYGGFAPGSYNAWALNLITNVFCTPGVARGMQVTAPGGMAVTLGVDAVALDGVVILPNGGWVRIDQAITYTVPNNGGTGTRTDAIVAFLDPTGVANPEFSLTYNSNWAGGFTGGTTNQTVIALISVAVGAVSIALNNITMNPNNARFGNNNQILDTDGLGIKVIDSSTTSQVTIQSTVGTPGYRALVLQAIDTAGVGHGFIFDQNGNETIPGTFFFGAGSGAYSYLTYNAAGFRAELAPPFGGLTPKGVDIAAWDGSSSHVVFSVGGQFGGAPSWIDLNNNFVLGGTLVFGPPASGSNAQLFYLNSINAVQLQAPAAGATPLGLSFGTWNGSAGKVPFSIGGQFNVASAWVDNAGNFNGPVNGGIPMTRNGSALSVPVFTGTNAPVNPPTGSVWIKA